MILIKGDNGKLALKSTGIDSVKLEELSTPSVTSLGEPIRIGRVTIVMKSREIHVLQKPLTEANALFDALMATIAE